MAPDISLTLDPSDGSVLSDDLDESGEIDLDDLDTPSENSNEFEWEGKCLIVFIWPLMNGCLYIHTCFYNGILILGELEKLKTGSWNQLTSMLKGFCWNMIFFLKFIYWLLRYDILLTLNILMAFKTTYSRLHRWLYFFFLISQCCEGMVFSCCSQNIA